VEPLPFFYAGAVGGESETLILDCYRLAKYYGIDPDHFLGKPLSTIQRHMKWTAKLIETQRQGDNEDG
jgi:hypothetical protein